MSMMECTCCRRRMDARSFRLCTDCGAPLCDDCANRGEGFCPDCEGRGYWR